LATNTKDNITVTPHLNLPLGNVPIATADPEVAEMQKEILRFQLQQLMKQSQAEAEALHRENVVRESTLKGMSVVQQEEARMRAACSHRKENYQTALGGQTDHEGVLHLFCTWCQKEGTVDQWPRELIPAQSTIGGPSN
jgi:hypothetical protein